MQSPHGRLIGFNEELDFCIWVLEVDGLRVAPFDRRRGGDGSLRALEHELRGLCDSSARPVLVFIVRYPGPVLYKVPPSVLKLGTVGWRPDAATLRTVVLDAAQELRSETA